MPSDRTTNDSVTPVLWLTVSAILLLVALGVFVHAEAWNTWAALNGPSDQVPSSDDLDKRAATVNVMAALVGVLPAIGLGLSIRRRSGGLAVLNGGILFLLVAFVLKRLFS